MEMHEIEVWVVVDEGGDYAVGSDQEVAEEAYDNDIGGSSCRRAVCIKLKVPAPTPITLAGEVPAEPQGGTLTVV